MNSSPLVSVIMPVYNAEKFVKPAIDSVLTQTFQDFEFIIINDGSTDRSEELICSYKDLRIRYFKQENIGVAKSLNKALKLARGTYIFRQDADDISLPERLETQLNFLKKNPFVDLVATQIAFMTERGKVAHQYKQPNDLYFDQTPSKVVKVEDFSPYSPITHASILCKTQVLRSLNGYRTAFITSEDVDLWLRLIQKYQAVVLNQCLYFVRVSRGSVTVKHGWKNNFYRELAKKFYWQRQNEESDDLQRQGFIEEVKPASNNIAYSKGKVFRADLLNYLYYVHLNAKDWSGAWRIIKYAIRDGWKLQKTWKAIIIPLIPKGLTLLILKIKGRLKYSSSQA